MNADDQDWTAGEGAQLRTLRVEKAPPEALEDSVINEMARRGLVARARPATWARTLAALTAAAALFGGGLLLGSRSGRAAGAPDLPRYLLLLEGADTSTVEEEAQRVIEYRAWAQREARAGRLVSGEKLEPQALTLGAEQAWVAGGEAARGFFIIVARSDAEALSIARGCPQLRYGGRIVVRKIAPT